MAWRTLTEADMLAALSSAEIEAYKRSDGYAEVLPRILADTAELVRSYCRSHGNLRLSPQAGAIPASLVAPATDYAVFQLLKRMPVRILEPRIAAKDDALRIFRDIAEGRVTPESHGDAPDAASGKVSVEIARQSRRRVTAEKLEGL